MARVLVVDDDPLARDVTARMVRLWGYQVETANDGEAALEKLRAHGADLVLLDLIMPKLDGLGVLEALARQPVSTRPAVILVTGDTEVTARTRGSELGALDFVAKPIRIEDLERRVRRTRAGVERGRQLGAAQSALEAIRRTDGATGAGSFAQLYGVLEAQFRAAELTHRPLSCILVADEAFGEVLSAEGREAGDARLHRLAALIEGAIRPTDFLFRVDAAEFVILVPAAGAADARNLAGDLRDHLLASGISLPADLAVAVASFPHPDVTQAAGLYRAANVALARARLSPEAGVVAYD